MPFIRPMLLLLVLAGLGAMTRRVEGSSRVLVFSHSTGYRHNSIESGVAAFRAMGVRRGFDVVASEDPNVFDRERLKDIDAIVLLSNTTKPDNPSSEWFVGARRAALQAFVRQGGGVLAIHAAADSHYHWPWYGRMIGGRFKSHPPGTPTGEVKIVEPRHPVARGLPSPRLRTDEWYFFRDRSFSGRAVATLDPASIGMKPGSSVPVAWAHEFEGGRVAYTAMGHTAESFAEPWFLQHLENALDWTLRPKFRR